MPTKAPDYYICAGCGTFEEYDLHKEQTFEYAGMKITRRVCWRCFQEMPCNKHFGGNHSEIIDLTDDEGRYVGVQFPEWVKTLPGHQVGFCINCHHWMKWSVEEQRWVDHYEPDEVPF